jgi:hypothetical protein
MTPDQRALLVALSDTAPTAVGGRVTEGAALRRR